MTPSINPDLFLASLRETMKDGIAAVALTEDEVFFLTNSTLQRPDRIAYGRYREFAAAYEANNYQLPNLPNAEALEDVYLYLHGERARQKLELLRKIEEGGKDYRRFCWLLELPEKQKRAETAHFRELAKEKREQEKAAREAEKAELTEKETATLGILSAIDTAEPQRQNHSPAVNGALHSV